MHQNEVSVAMQKEEDHPEEIGQKTSRCVRAGHARGLLPAPKILKVNACSDEIAM
jgi:ribosomal protein S14